MIKNQNEERMKALNFQFLNQNLMNLKNQIETINLQIIELNHLKIGLTELKDVKDKQTFIPLGNGVFLETVINQPKGLLMNVGSNILVKKDFESTGKLIEKQIGDLNSINLQLNHEIEKIEKNLLAF